MRKDLHQPTLDAAHRSPPIAELDWAPYVYKVLQQMHEGFDIMPSAQLVMDDIIADTAARIVTAARGLPSLPPNAGCSCPPPPRSLSCTPPVMHRDSSKLQKLRTPRAMHHGSTLC